MAVLWVEEKKKHIENDDKQEHRKTTVTSHLFTKCIIVHVYV